MIIGCCLLFVVYLRVVSLLFVFCRVLFVVCCLVIGGWLFVDGCSLIVVVCLLLFVGCCLLGVVCWLLIFGVCALFDVCCLVIEDRLLSSLFVVRCWWLLRLRLFFVCCLLLFVGC